MLYPESCCIPSQKERDQSLGSIHFLFFRPRANPRCSHFEDGPRNFNQYITTTPYWQDQGLSVPGRQSWSLARLTIKTITYCFLVGPTWSESLAAHLEWKGLDLHSFPVSGVNRATTLFRHGLFIFELCK